VLAPGEEDLAEQRGGRGEVRALGVDLLEHLDRELGAPFLLVQLSCGERVARARASACFAPSPASAQHDAASSHWPTLAEQLGGSRQLPARRSISRLGEVAGALVAGAGLVEPLSSWR
jgi:hypothetical protein